MASALSRYRKMLKDASYTEMNDTNPDEFLCHSLQNIFEKNLVPTKTKELDPDNIATLDALMSNLSPSCRTICMGISRYRDLVEVSFIKADIIDAVEYGEIDNEYKTNPNKLITELLNSQILLEVEGKYIVRPEFRNILKLKLSEL